ECINLKEVNLPDNIETLRRGCFMLCSALSCVKMSCKVKCVEDYCFEDCANLREIVFDGVLENVGNDVFKNCKLLKPILIAKKKTVSCKLTSPIGKDKEEDKNKGSPNTKIKKEEITKKKKSAKLENLLKEYSK
ncbi:hypothetical protein EIN_122430, partial [Entamoeba invadens IP1]